MISSQIVDLDFAVEEAHDMNILGFKPTEFWQSVNEWSRFWQLTFEKDTLDPEDDNFATKKEDLLYQMACELRAIINQLNEVYK